MRQTAKLFRQRTGASMDGDDDTDPSATLPELADLDWMHHGTAFAATSFWAVARRLPAIVREAIALAWGVSRRDTVAAIAGDRPRVLVVARDGTGLSGQVRSVGRDVAVLRLADAADVLYLPLASMAERAVVEG